MPLDRRCEMTDLLVESCGHCNGAEERAKEAGQEEAAGLGPPFAAQYDGECIACGAGIRPGDTIRANGRYGYLCGECGGMA